MEQMLLSAKTAKITSLENLYVYGNLISTSVVPHDFSHVKCKNFSCKSLFT